MMKPLLKSISLHYNRAHISALHLFLTHAIITGMGCRLAVFLPSLFLSLTLSLPLSFFPLSFPLPHGLLFPLLPPWPCVLEVLGQFNSALHS